VSGLEYRVRIPGGAESDPVRCSGAGRIR